MANENENPNPDPVVDPPAPDPTPGNTGDNNAQTPEQLRAELERERTARAQAQKDADEREARLKEFEAAEEKRKSAEMTEVEREKTRAEAAEAALKEKDERLRRREILDAVRSEATKQRLDVDSEAVADLYAAGAFNAIKLDKDGNPQDVDTALKDLVKRKPYIVKTKVQAPDINATKTGDQKAGEMTDDRKAELKARFRLR